MVSFDKAYEHGLNTLYGESLQSVDSAQSLDKFLLFVETLSLDDSMQWLQSHPDTKPLIAERLTHVDPPKISQRVCATYKTLWQQTHGVGTATSGDMVALYMPGKTEPSANLPRNMLACQCAVFRTQLAPDFKMSPAQNNALHLVGDNEEILTQFTSFLVTGSLSLNAQNVLQLHNIGSYYGCSALTDMCEKFLMDNASKDDLPHLLEYALKNGNASIMATCKTIIWDNREHVQKIVREIALQDEEELPEWQIALMKIAGSIPKLPDKWEYHRGRLTVSEVNENKIWPIIKQYKEWGLNAIDFVENMPGSSLSKIASKLREMALDTQVKELIVHLPQMQTSDLEQLRSIASLTGFANRAFQPDTLDALLEATKQLTQVLKLDLLGLNCKKISMLNGQALQALFLQFPRLQYLAIKSEHILALVCPTSLVELDCADCHRLTQLDAANARRILCRYCFQLQTLKAPFAKQLDRRDCPLLPK